VQSYFLGSSSSFCAVRIVEFGLQLPGLLHTMYTVVVFCAVRIVEFGLQLPGLLHTMYTVVLLLF